MNLEEVINARTNNRFVRYKDKRVVILNYYGHHNLVDVKIAGQKEVFTVRAKDLKDVK